MVIAIILNLFVAIFYGILVKVEFRRREYFTALIFGIIYGGFTSQFITGLIIYIFGV